jgi:hypothetical protein
VKEPVRVGDVIARSGRAPRVDPLVAEARAVWTQAVGADVARHSTPVRLKGGELVVHCESSTWASELALLERQVRAKLDGLLPAPPSRLRFEVGRVEAPPESVPPRPPQRPASEQERRFAEQVAAGVEDESLREAIRAAVEGSLRRGGGPTS